MRSVVATVALLLVAVMAAGEDLFIPMVAQKQGQDGAWWNTEVWIANATSATGAYAVVFLPAGQANVEGLQAEPAQEDIPPGVTVYRKDLVPQGQSGVLRIVASQGTVALARVFSAAGKGSFGQGIPAQPRSAALKPGEIGQLLGLRRTPQFRTNIGVFNPTPDNGLVRIRLYQASGAVVGEQSYRIAGGGFLQLDDALHAFEVTRAEQVRAEISGTVPCLAYASVVDARSGAPTLIQSLR